MNFNKDDFVLISYGDLETYHINRAVLVLKPFNPTEELIKWGAENARPDKNPGTYVINHDGIHFEQWLLKEGLIADIQAKEMHLGDGISQVFVDVVEE